MLQSYYLFILTLAMVAHSAPRHQTPEEWAREQNDQRFNRDAYDGLPWEEYSKQGFSPRKPPRRLRLADSDRQRAFPPTLTSDDFAPTRTHAMSLMRRAPQATFTCNPGANCYTFNCPTSVQCVDGGCCPIGDYCGIKNGVLGCCLFNAPCDTAPIPGCSVSCYGICCDLVQDIIGEPICSPTAGAEGQSSGICTGVARTSIPPQPTPTCSGTDFLCASQCCPGGAGLVCDNTTVPGAPFCNIAC